MKTKDFFSFTLNDIIWIKLTKQGLKVIEDYYDPNLIAKKIFPDGKNFAGNPIKKMPYNKAHVKIGMQQKWYPLAVHEFLDIFGKNNDANVEKRFDFEIRIEKSDLKQAKDNPETEEWLQYQKEINQKTLFVKEYDNYGYISGYYLPIDSPEEKIGQYRNTKEKIELIAKSLKLKPASYMIGGLGDSGTINPWGFEISIDQINKLKLKGYIFNEFKPLSS